MPTSFFCEDKALIKGYECDAPAHCVVSNKVHKNFMAIWTLLSEGFLGYEVEDTRRITLALPRSPNRHNNSTILFGALGLDHSVPRNAHWNSAGDTQPWISYPGNDACQ